MLRYCPKCREKSAVRKIYSGKRRVEFCINRGCGYQLRLPDIRKENNLCQV